MIASTALHAYFPDGSASGSDLSPHSHTLTMTEFRSGGGSSSSAYDIPTAYTSGGGGGGSTRSQPTAGWMNTLSNRSTAASKRSSGTGGSQGIEC